MLIVGCWGLIDDQEESFFLLQSTIVGFAIYNSPWYHFNTGNKMTMMLILARTQQPLQIMIGDFAPMNLETFQKIVNASYSYFALLRKSLL